MPGTRPSVQARLTSMLRAAKEAAERTPYRSAIHTDGRFQLYLSATEQQWHIAYYLRRPFSGYARVPRNSFIAALTTEAQQ